MWAFKALYAAVHWLCSALVFLSISVRTPASLWLCQVWLEKRWRGGQPDDSPCKQGCQGSSFAQQAHVLCTHAGVQAVWHKQDTNVAKRAPGPQNTVQCMRREGSEGTAAYAHWQYFCQPQQGQGRPAHASQES